MYTGISHPSSLSPGFILNKYATSGCSPSCLIGYGSNLFEGWACPWPPPLNFRHCWFFWGNRLIWGTINLPAVYNLCIIVNQTCLKNYVVDKLQFVDWNDSQRKVVDVIHHCCTLTIPIPNGVRVSWWSLSQYNPGGDRYTKGWN